MKRGITFGGIGGYKLGNDIDNAALNFTDTITSISAVESSDLSGSF